MMTRAEWNQMNDARQAGHRAHVRELLAREKAARAYRERVAREGPLVKLAEAEARVRAEVAFMEQLEVGGPKLVALGVAIVKLAHCTEEARALLEESDAGT